MKPGPSLWTAAGALALAAVPAGAQNPAPLHIESYFQLRITDSRDASPYAGVRRFRLNLSGQPSKDASWFVQLFYKDGNRSATDHTVFVQDFWYRRRFSWGTVTAGQLRPPFALERLTTDRLLGTIDRTAAVDALIPAGGMARSFARDLGVLWERGTERSGLVQAGLFGGNGALQQASWGNGPLAAARLVRGWADGAGERRLGVALALRRDRQVDFSRALPGTRPLGMDRFRGQDLRAGLEGTVGHGSWRLQGEYLEGRFQGDAGSPFLTACGGYLLAGCHWTSDWEAVLRQESFDPNRAVRDRNDTSATTLGINGRVGPRRRDRLQINYVFRRERVQERPNDTVLVQYQRTIF